MKILKHGDLKPRKFICERCKCEFVADKSEYSEDNIYTTHPTLTTTCPCCNHKIVVMHDRAPVYEEECQDTFYELMNKLDLYADRYIDRRVNNAYDALKSIKYDLMDWRRKNESKTNN